MSKRAVNRFNRAKQLKESAEAREQARWKDVHVDFVEDEQLRQQLIDKTESMILSGKAKSSGEALSILASEGLHLLKKQIREERRHKRRSTRAKRRAMVWNRQGKYQAPEDPQE